MFDVIDITVQLITNVFWLQRRLSLCPSMLRTQSDSRIMPETHQNRYSSTKSHEGKIIFETHVEHLKYKGFIRGTI